MKCCPFCGNAVTEAAVRQSRTGWKEYTDKHGIVHRHYVDATQDGATPCWEISCDNCGAQLSADSREALLEKWNNPVRSEWADQESEDHIPYLQRCPLCDLNVMACTDDSFHSAAKSWILVNNKKKYFHIRDPEYLTGTRCYVASCPESAGGCGLSLEGESLQETADKWNNRVTRG